MSIIDTISMFSIMLALALVPSASVVLVVTRSVTLDIANGIAVSLGIVLGDLVFIILVILGLSIVVETMAWLFVLIKYAGAAYLIWLGCRLIISKRKVTLPLDKIEAKGSYLISFVSGFLLTLGDIKAIFFYMSLFPVFINLETLSLFDVSVIMLVTVFAVGGAKVFYAFSSKKLMLMSKGFKLEDKAKTIAGSLVIIGAVGYLITKA